MANLLVLLFVALVVVFGAGACWIIAGNGMAKTPTTDSFGNQAPDTDIAQQGAASTFSVSTMFVFPTIFIIVVCAIIVAAVAWLYKTGKNSNKNGY